MTPIPISSCHHCDPETWVAQGESKGTYRCDNCRRIIEEVLKRKGDQQ